MSCGQFLQSSPVSGTLFPQKLFPEQSGSGGVHPAKHPSPPWHVSASQSGSGVKRLCGPHPSPGAQVAAPPQSGSIGLHPITQKPSSPLSHTLPTQSGSDGRQPARHPFTTWQVVCPQSGSCGLHMPPPHPSPGRHVPPPQSGSIGLQPTAHASPGEHVATGKDVQTHEPWFCRQTSPFPHPASSGQLLQSSPVFILPFSHSVVGPSSVTSNKGDFLKITSVPLSRMCALK